VAAPGLAAAPASGTEGLTHRVTTQQFRFIPDQLLATVGDSLIYTNADFDDHNLVSERLGPDGQPLFKTPIIGLGESAPVAGVENLDAGTYPFYCAPHPWMIGNLEVVEPPPMALRVADVPSPTSIAIRGEAAAVSRSEGMDHAGTLYIASQSEGAVFAADIEDEGLLGRPVPYATGLERPQGIALDTDGTLFVSDSHASVTAGRERDGRVWAVPQGGGDVRSVGQVVLDGLPAGRSGTNGLAVSDGRLYVTNGTSTDNGASGGPPDQPLSGVLVSVPTSARELTPADLEPEGTTGEPGLLIEAEGLRNPTDVAFRSTTAEAWMPSIGPDGMDPFGEDLLYRAQVLSPPPDFGFPACVYRQTLGSLVEGQNTAVAEECDGTQARPEAAFGLDTSPSGLAFGPDDAYWRGDLFVALAGRAGDGLSDPRVCFAGIQANCGSGHRVVRVPIDSLGRAGQPTSIFASGDPVDVAFGPDELYVADRTGRIFLLRAS
jgi:glucose/arabinose dehydrogenase/plastocyanin